MYGGSGSKKYFVLIYIWKLQNISTANGFDRKLNRKTTKQCKPNTLFYFTRNWIYIVIYCSSFSHEGVLYDFIMHIRDKKMFLRYLDLHEHKLLTIINFKHSSISWNQIYQTLYLNSRACFYSFIFSTHAASSIQ